MKTKDALKVKGTFRLNIMEDGKIVGDSGWVSNQITNLGFQNFLVRTMAGLSGSSQVSHVALGTGGAPASNATSLTGEVVKRASVTAATNGSTSAQFTATFSSSDSFVTNTQNLSNVGLFATSASGTLFAGNTFASSSCATNQNVNVTYSINFS
jgi:hypothetical protein